MQLQEQCEPEMLEKLQAALDAVSSQDFHYDKEYIQSTMGWDQNAPAPQVPHESAFSGETMHVQRHGRNMRLLSRS